VHFVGFKNQTELPQYYGLADIFVLPSGIGETWGLVVNEAMCFGLPIIVSDLVGCGSDLVKPAENGYTFPVGDVKELVNRLEGLIANRESRIAFGEKSFEIIQNYNYEKDVDGILTAMS
jgi:glycosyltransferase involved in cell wall biosynthesis